MTPPYTFEQFADVRQCAPCVAFSPDGHTIAYVENSSGQMNLWLVPSMGEGTPRQLTHFTDHAVRDFAWSPDGRQLIFYADHHSDERHQMYLIAVDGTSEPQQITHAPHAQHIFYGRGIWSPDGTTVAYTCNDNKDDPSIMELVLHNVHTGETRRPKRPDARYYPLAWSPDGEYLTLMARRPGLDTDVVLIHKSGDSQVITTHYGNTIDCMPGPWMPKSDGFYMLLDMEKEYMSIAQYQQRFNRWDWVHIGQHDVEHLALSKDGRVLVWTENMLGVSKLCARDMLTGQALKMPELPMGVVQALALSPDGQTLALVFTTAREAPHLVEIHLQMGQLRRITHSMVGGVDPAHLLDPELIDYPTFDGRNVPALLFRPKGEGPFPVLVSIHGGPEYQERPEYLYLGMYQYLAQQGVMVLGLNIRGSTGYGVTYKKLIRRDWGGGDLQDIEHAALYLRGRSDVDATRIAVHGRSFGGFATLSALSRLPDYWCAGVDVVGPANLITFLKSTPAFWKTFLKTWLGDPQEDRDFLQSRSPINYVQHIRVPLLVIQGGKDPRVVQAESDQMVDKIREAGGDVTYYVDPISGHMPTKRESYLEWIKRVVAFLEQHLLHKTP
jgi:dipeptidyl aminopeptidase/acylaminoacyl peptidase